MKTLESKMCRCGVLSIVVLTWGLISSGLAAEGIWTKKADMPTARLMLGTCVVDGKIYAIGGAPAPHVGLSTVEEYDPGTDTWARKAPMPTPRAGLGVSAVNGKIYAIGGEGRTVEEYDPGTDTWIRKADMPTARGFFTTSVVNGKIYAVGGALGTGGPAFKMVEEYDPATDTWERKADLPEPRYFHAASVVDGKIYVIAGSWQAYTASRAVYAYDPATNTWERKTDAPTVGSWLSASEVDGRIYVIGIGEDTLPKGVAEYDPATDTWKTRADMPTARAALSTCELNGKIYAVGGTATTAYNGLSTVEEYYPNPLVVDFNSDGLVNIEDLLRLIESWGQDDPAVDIGPRPFGDGIIDAADLEVLMDYWSQEITSPLLVAHWRLDEYEGTTAEDSIGVNDATVIGVPAWQPTDGQFGGAMLFDGATRIAADMVLSPADGPFSVFAWVKGGAPGQTILSQQGGANWLLADPATGALATELQSGGRDAKALCSDANITDGMWHRVGIAWNGGSRSLYVDDVLVAEDMQQGLVACYGGLQMGCGKEAKPGTFWSGLIDDVRIYNRAVKP